MLEEKYISRIYTHIDSRSPGFSLDPVTIIALVNCVISIARLLYICYTTEGRYVAAHNPGPLAKALLKRQVNKNFKHLTKQDKKNIYNSLLDFGKTLSEKEIAELTEMKKETNK